MNVVSTINGNESVMSIDDYMFNKKRTIDIVGVIDSDVAKKVVDQLLFLDSKSSEDPVVLRINSPGGSVTDGMAIYDTIKDVIRCETITIGYGLCASMGAFLLAAGTAGKRWALPNTEIMIHQPLGGIHGQAQATDIVLHATHLQEVKQRLVKILAAECNKGTRVVANDLERDKWMTPRQALSYGLIDHIGYAGEEELTNEY